MRLLDVVLGERSMDGQRARKAVPEQLPRSLAGDHRDTDEDLGMVLALLLFSDIHQCQTSEGSAAKFKELLEEFYSDSPERLMASLFGLTLVVKKPNSDQEQD